MLQLDLKRKGNIDLLFKDLEKKNTYTPRQKVERLILRDLLRLDWKISFGDNKIIVDPPKNYNKDIIRQSMSHRRKEYIDVHADWIEKNIEFARKNLANGEDVLKSKIKPVIEVCETPKQHDLFRMYRYYWSSAYSEYVGRRIKLIIRDAGLPNRPVIGIAALGSSIIHIPDRDNWVGWDKNQRTNLYRISNRFEILIKSRSIAEALLLPNFQALSAPRPFNEW